jgi:hypothetical protein
LKDKKVMALMKKVTVQKLGFVSPRALQYCTMQSKEGKKMQQNYNYGRSWENSW